MYGGQIFEIDIYPFRKNSCVMETELKNETDRPELPPFVRVVKEVTGDHRYSNASLAKSIPTDWQEEKPAAPPRLRRTKSRSARRAQAQRARKTSQNKA